MKHNEGPIKSQSEADEVKEWLITTTAEKLNISKEQAGKRVAALLKSGIMEGGSPDNPVHQFKIEQFLMKQQ